MPSNEILTTNKNGWDKVAEKYYGATCLPAYGPFAPSEEELKLFGEVTGKKILEIGCGSGHSLLYLASKGAEELWGLDLSTAQIGAAKQLLEQNDVEAQLFNSPMEHDPGIAQAYFDIVCSIYALGWSTNLPQTLANIYGWLKVGGQFIFSWEHPLHSRLEQFNNKFIIARSYHTEGEATQESWRGISAEMVIKQRKVSTFINELIDAGFIIDRMIEESRVPAKNDMDATSKWYSPQKAAMAPATMIIKCHK